MYLQAGSILQKIDYQLFKMKPQKIVIDIDSYNVDHKFSDINDFWAATYVDFLYNANITTGYSDGSFKPHSNITRGQMAKILYNLL